MTSGNAQLKLRQPFSVTEQKLFFGGQLFCQKIFIFFGANTFFCLEINFVNKLFFCFQAQSFLDKMLT